jgi:signal peptidase I
LIRDIGGSPWKMRPMQGIESMHARLPLAILVFGMVVAAPAKADPNAEAKALFAEATELFKKAAQTKYDAAIPLSQDGLAKVEQILERYGSTDMAFQIATGATGQIASGKKTMPSGSMLPTLASGQEFVVFRYDDPSALKRGDIILYSLPRDRSIELVHRVIGLPGDRIQMVSGLPHINGQPIGRQRADDFLVDGKPIKRWNETLPDGASHFTIDLVEGGFYDTTPVYTTPAGSIFVMGDNRDNTTDSRVLSQVGYIPIENVQGRVVPLRKK